MNITFIDNAFLINLTNFIVSPAADSKTDGVALTIGNFDGLHLGHQQMVNTTIDLATKNNLSSAVMVFEPMPKEFFSPETAPERLMNRLETEYIFSKYHYLEKTIEQLFIVDFNEVFRSLSAAEFTNLLTKKLNVKTIVLGDDFRFGHDRLGNSKFLSTNGINVIQLNTITDKQPEASRISSTRIRELLQAGQLNSANLLLGREYCMIGEVQHGDKIGRTLNFPTANVAMDRLTPALHGIFAVDVQILDTSNDNQVISNVWQNIAEDEKIGFSGLEKDSLFGTANVGTRPAVGGQEWRLEVHFPEFKGDLYGKTLKVRFLYYLHGERKYNGLDELKSGINQDVADLLTWRTKQLQEELKD